MHNGAGQSSGPPALAHLLAPHSMATPKQAKEPTFAAAQSQTVRSTKMKRSDYLETRQGQAHERLARSLDKIYLHIEQEPKSKNGITLAEQREFRKQVKDYLKKSSRRPFRGDIILEIDFQTTEDNPPALQTLTKNYLDLLHKSMPNVD